MNCQYRQHAGAPAEARWSLVDIEVKSCGCPGRATPMCDACLVRRLRSDTTKRCLLCGTGGVRTWENVERVVRLP
jgi:dihydroorotate dehydrogenase